MTGEIGGEQRRSEPPVLHLAAELLGPVPRLALGLQVTHGGNRLGAHHEAEANLAGGDAPGELGDEVLRPLPADDLEDGAFRVRADALGDGAREVVGSAEGRDGPGDGGLELPYAGDGVDLRREGLDRERVRERRRRRLAGKIGRGERGVVRVVQSLGRLAHPDDYRNPVPGHSASSSFELSMPSLAERVEHRALAPARKGGSRR